MGRRLLMSAELAAQVSEVDAQLRAFNAATPTSPHLESLGRFLLRSEAVASSRIEGVVASGRAVAHLEMMLAMRPESDPPQRGFSDSAREVVNNVLAMREAVGALTTTDTVGVAELNDLQSSLLAGTEHASLGGELRTVQNWVGGHEYGPHGAEYVPPPAEDVPGLMEDLSEFLNAKHPLPLVQAALVHAQFETIHPYADGNGRAGRALIHTVLARQGLVIGRVLPISLALLAHPREYIAGLNAYRYQGAATDPEAITGTEKWLRVFLSATRDAVTEAVRFTAELTAMQEHWHRQLSAYRSEKGLRAQPRKGAAVLRLMEQMPGLPIVTARAVQSLLKVSFVAASAALEELHGAGIVAVKEVNGGTRAGTRAFLSQDVLDLVSGAERRLTYTQWD